MEWIKCDSTAADEFAYDGESGTLSIRFNNGSLYEYYDVPEEVFAGLLEAQSVGRYLNDNVTSTYGYAQVG